MTKRIDSILNSIKKALNIPMDVDAFDSELIMYINSVFSQLQQVGVISNKTFYIEDDSETWSDFASGTVLPESANDDVDVLNMVQTYMYLEVRLVFDPPTASLLTSMEKKRDELAWRLNVTGDHPIDREENQNEIE